MNNWKYLRKVKRKGTALMMGAIVFAFPWGGCQLDQITATSTVTLDGREVMISLIRGAILTPLDAWITAGVNQVFDELADNEE